MKLTGKGFNAEAVHPELASLDLFPARRVESITVEEIAGGVGGGVGGIMAVCTIACSSDGDNS